MFIFRLAHEEERKLSPQPRVPRQGASFQNAYISPKCPYFPDLGCIVIVYYKCSTGSTTCAKNKGGSWSSFAQKHHLWL